MAKSKNVIELTGNDLRYAREYTKTIREKSTKIAEIDDQIAKLTAELRAEKVNLSAELAKSQTQLLELIELPDEAGTYHLPAVSTKITITATYVAEDPADATNTLKALLGADDRLSDTVMVPKREFSRSGYNAAVKLAPELEDWYEETITAKLSKPKIEIEG